MFKRFRQWLVEHVAQQQVMSVLQKHGQSRDIGVGRYSVQFVLPDGKGVEVDKDEVHARAFRNAAQADGVDARLIDALRSGVVRSADAARYQVCSPITSAQAQFMVDRAMAVKDNTVMVSVADAGMADSEADENQGAGPIEINDKTYKNFDLDRAKPATIRNWVATQVN